MFDADTPILYVEDDKPSREIMGVLLTTMLKFTRVTIFEDSHNFVDRLLQLSPTPKIIFLDIHVRPYSGYEMFQMIQDIPELHATKVVAVTASIMSNEVDQLRKLGFRHLIGKPINPTTFPSLLNAISNGQDVWDISWQ